MLPQGAAKPIENAFHIACRIQNSAYGWPDMPRNLLMVSSCTEPYSTPTCQFVYVGETNNFERRKAEHLRPPRERKTRHKPGSIKAWLKDAHHAGVAPKFVILEVTETEEQSRLSELVWVEKLAEVENWAIQQHVPCYRESMSHFCTEADLTSGFTAAQALAQHVCGADRERLDGERGGLAAAGTGKDAGIGDVEVAPAVAAAARVDHRVVEITAHPAGAEHVSRGEVVVVAVFLENFLDSRCLQDGARLIAHEGDAADLAILEPAVNARERHSRSILALRIEVNEGTVVGQAFGDAGDCERMAEHLAHACFVRTSESTDHPGRIGDRADQIGLSGADREAAAAKRKVSM